MKYLQPSHCNNDRMNAPKYYVIPHCISCLNLRSRAFACVVSRLSLEIGLVQFRLGYLLYRMRHDCSRHSYISIFLPKLINPALSTIIAMQAASQQLTALLNKALSSFFVQSIQFSFGQLCWKCIVVIPDRPVYKLARLIVVRWTNHELERTVEYSVTSDQIPCML